MAIDQHVITVLQAEFAPTPVRNLHGEQLNDLSPAKVPLVLVERSTVNFGEFGTYCAKNPTTAEVVLGIEYLALTLEQARRMADAGRAALTTQFPATIESEIDQWDSSIRVYRVSQSYSATDTQPAIV